MPRSNVYLTASNDYREVGVGGRGNSNSGRSWINMDVYKEEVQSVRDKRFKKQEVFNDEMVKVWEGEQNVTTKVYREEDGRASITFSLSPADNLPVGNTSIRICFKEVGFTVDPAELYIIVDALPKTSHRIIMMVYLMMQLEHREFTAENIQATFDDFGFDKGV